MDRASGEVLSADPYNTERSTRALIFSPAEGEKRALPEPNQPHPPPPEKFAPERNAAGELSSFNSLLVLSHWAYIAAETEADNAAVGRIVARVRGLLDALYSAADRRRSN